jgi:excisionase family DNA binding protein
MAYTPDELALLVQWHHEQVPIKEQAARLGRAYGTIAMARRRLAAKGLITLPERSGWRPWTADDETQLELLLAQGLPYTQIAKRLRRTRVAVVIRCKRQQMRLLTIPGVLSARDVAEQLGLACSKKVADWIARGWLKARNGGTKDKPLWRIQDLDLLAFLENSDYWMSWDPHHIPDPAFREWAVEQRQHGPDWITTGEAARRLHVIHNTVHQWIEKGYLTAKRYGNWYVDGRTLGAWWQQHQAAEHRRRSLATRTVRAQKRAQREATREAA